LPIIAALESFNQGDCVGSGLYFPQQCFAAATDESGRDGKYYNIRIPGRGHYIIHGHLGIKKETLSMSTYCQSIIIHPQYLAAVQSSACTWHWRQQWLFK